MMAVIADHEDEWLVQLVEESEQFVEDRSKLVIGEGFIPTGDHHLNL